MEFNTTFNNISVISWRSVLLVEETRVPRKKTTDLSQVTVALYHIIVSPLAGFELTTLVVIDTDCTVSCKRNTTTIRCPTTTAPVVIKKVAILIIKNQNIFNVWLIDWCLTPTYVDDVFIICTNNEPHVRWFLRQFENRPTLIYLKMGIKCH